MAYERLEPFHDRRGDWQAAAICSVIVNMAAAQSGSKKRVSPNDFLLEFGKEPVKKEENWKRLKAIAMSYSRMANAIQRADQKKRRRR